MPIWRIGKIGTPEVAIEEAETEEAACLRAGWKPGDCEAVDITERIQVLKEKNGAR